ncbi:MAG: hypothetical protein RBT73_00990 [Spirochaetia bacterium]|jgi:hypothetical protein|nr:hypothetical protein [Spirochaetia bacterium]
MKKIVYGLILILFVVSGRVGLAAAALDDSSPFSVLEGEYLTEAEMEDIVGGLPRCCHDPQYDAIEDKCLNNKGQKYEKAINDCDIWTENNLSQAGYNIASKWGPAKTTSVKGHMEKLKGELTDTAPIGWSIEFIDNSHVALVRVNEDGSADLFHQGNNAGRTPEEDWEGARGYHYSNAKSAYWGKTRSFWNFL